MLEVVGDAEVCRHEPNVVKLVKRRAASEESFPPLYSSANSMLAVLDIVGFRIRLEFL